MDIDLNINYKKYLEKKSKKSSLNFVGILRCMITRIYLRLRFPFNGIKKWHFRANYYCRPYKKNIVDIVNTVKPDIVVEIGCGIGDICTRVESSKVYGIDIDKKAINIAKKLSQFPNYINDDPLKNKNNFESFLNSMPESEIKFFIAVNWLHSVSYPLVKDFMERLLRVPNIYLLVDKYTRGYKFKSTNKKFNHDFEMLFQKERYILIKNIDEVRDFIILENIK